MVVSLTQLQLLVILGDARADRSRASEVERRTFHTANCSSRNQSGVDGSEPAGMQPELMLENIALPLSRQIEIGVIRPVEDRVLVGSSGVLDAQLIVVGKSVGDLRWQVAGITFFSVFAQLVQLED